MKLRLQAWSKPTKKRIRMTFGFSKFHQQVPLTKFLGTTKYMKRSEIVIFHIKTRQFFVHNTLHHKSFLGS